MKKLVHCLFIFLTAVCAERATAQPKLETDTFQIDLGMADAGTVIERVISVRNAGTEALMIEKAQTSCPCTTVSLPDGSDGTVAPGASLPLWLRYDTEDRHGAYGAAVVVHSNDPEQPIAVFEVGVVITKPVVTDPPENFGWGLAPRGHVIEKPLIIRAGDPEQPIELVELTFAEEGMTAETRHEIEAGRERLETRFALAPELPLGIHENEATIRVRVNGAEHEVRMPIQGSVLGDVLVTPPAIISPRSAYTPGDKISEITVQPSSGEGDIHVIGAPTTGALKTNIRPREDGSGYLVEVLAGQADQSGPQSGTVYVMSTSKDEPIVGVPVFFRTADIVVARPFAIVFDAGDSAAQRVALGHVHGRGFRVTNATCASEAVEVNVERAASAGPSVPAVIRVVPTGAAGDAVAALLEVSTDADGGTTVTVPVLLRAED